MSEVAIFLYGLAVFAIVSAACALIVWGMREERRDRALLDTQARRAGAFESGAATGESGETVSTGRGERGAG